MGISSKENLPKFTKYKQCIFQFRLHLLGFVFLLDLLMGHNLFTAKQSRPTVQPRAHSKQAQKTESVGGLGSTKGNAKRIVFGQNNFEVFSVHHECFYRFILLFAPPTMEIQMGNFYLQDLHWELVPVPTLWKKSCATWDAPKRPIGLGGGIQPTFGVCKWCRIFSNVQGNLVYSFQPHLGGKHLLSQNLTFDFYI